MMSLIDRLSKTIKNKGLWCPGHIDISQSKVLSPSEVYIHSEYFPVTVSLTEDGIYIVAKQDESGSIVKLWSFSEEACEQFLMGGMRSEYIASRLLAESAIITQVIPGFGFWEIKTGRSTYILVDEVGGVITHRYNLSHYDDENVIYLHLDQWITLSGAIEAIDPVVKMVSDAIIK